jgi:hypothetical protein
MTTARAARIRSVVPPAVVAGSAILTCAVVLTGAPTPVRAVVVASFALFVPGGAVVPLLAVSDVAAQLMLCLAVSLSLDLAVGCALVYAGAWSPPTGILVLAALALAGAGHQARRARNRNRSANAPRPAPAPSEERPA